MHDDHSSTDKKTVERAANAHLAVGPQLEKPAAKRTRVRKPEIRPVLCQQLQQSRIVREDVNRPRLDLRENALVEVLDSKRHEAMLANMLTSRKVGG